MIIQYIQKQPQNTSYVYMSDGILLQQGKHSSWVRLNA